MRKVEIDIEVHKRIEQSRVSFKESENSILRRILGIDGPKIEPPQQLPKPVVPKPTSNQGQTRSWIGTNRKTGREVRLAHGTEARANYGGQEVVAVIENGKWKVGSASYDSPSIAVMENVKTRNGERPSLSGWREWKILAGSPPSWVRLVDL